MFDRITPVVKNLLLLNIGIYFLSLLAPLVYNYFTLYTPLLASTSGELVWNTNFKPWQLLTYMFLHSPNNIGHIFGNMFGLFTFGPALEIYMGSKRFLIYYVLTGIGAGILGSIANYYEFSSLSFEEISYIINNYAGGMVGASGAIFGILVAFGILFPNVELTLLFFPMPIKAKYFVALYGLYELFAGAAGIQQGIAHFAHIGGLITGFILLKIFSFDRRTGGDFRIW